MAASAAKKRVPPGRPVAVPRVSPALARWQQVFVVACVVVVVSPVVFNPWGYEQYQLPKLAVQATAVVVALLALVVGEGVPFGRVLIPLGLFLAALAVSAAMADAPSIAFLGTGSRHFGVVSWLLLAGAFVIGMGCSAPERRRQLLLALLAASPVVAAYGVLQRVGWDPFAPAGTGPALRQASTVGSATYLGGYLALVVGVGAAASAGRVFSWKWLGPVVALDFLALLLTGSRGGWAGAAAAFLLVAAVAMRRYGRRTTLLVLAAVVCVAALAVVLVPGLSSRAQSLLHPGSGTAGGRVEIAGMAIGAIGERPILGWGPDESRPALHGQIGSDYEARYFDDRIEDRAHDWLLDIALWSGVVGLGLFLWFLVAVARVGVAQRDDWLVIAIGAGLLAFAAHLTFNFPVPDLDIVVWLLAGTLVRPVARRTTAVPISIAGVVAAALLLAVLLPAVGLLLADRSLRVGIDKENAGDAAGARQAYEAARSDAPDSEIYREVLARYYLRAGDPTDAVTEARAGRRLDPSDPYLAELLARSLSSAALAARDATAARESEQILRGLITDSPYDGSLHLELGNALAAQNRLAEAKVEYERATQLVPYRSEPFRNLGLIAEQQGDLKSAHWHYLQATSVDPNDPVAKAALDRVIVAEQTTTTTSP